ncbi:DUF2726 domain-containing protein [Candidatus Beckwithbacteria bacterium]|nr:DUF2726 domain-containing protein [Candidatus Beckwithbacteria bacterium]
MIFELVLILFLLFVFVGFVIMTWKFYDERNKNLYLQNKFNPFKNKERFLTPNEKHVFEKLQELECLKNLYIFSQLHLSTFLGVKEEANDLRGKFDWINKLFVDFVIFDNSFTKPLLVIELNDSTHKWSNRKARDEFIRSALDNNNIKMLTITLNDANTRGILEDLVGKKLF